MRMSMNTALSGSGRVDDIQSHPQGEFRGQTNLAKITEDARKFAAEQKLSEDEALQRAWNKNRESFPNWVRRFTRRPECIKTD